MKFIDIFTLLGNDLRHPTASYNKPLVGKTNTVMA
jgi:hypothetical protein